MKFQKIILQPLSHFASIVGFLCFSTSTFAQPANDNPCNATPLTANPACTYVSATNVAATSTSGVPAPGCASYSNNDVWFSVVVPAGGAVNIDSNTGSMTDGGMAVYSGTCSALTLVDCDDDSSPNGSMPSIGLTGLTPGSTIFIRFWKYGGGTGTFSICATAPEPAPPCGSSPAAGNTCATATPICDLNGYCGNTSASYTANSWSQGCGFLNLSDCGLTGVFCGSIENNSFLSFVASGTSISFDVWVNSSTLGYGIQILIFSSSGACSGDVTQYGPCYNPGVVEQGPVNITATGLTPGNTYYIMIDGNSGDVCNYTIGANSGVSLPVSITPSSSTICQGDAVTLNATGGNGTYSWTGSAGLNTTSGANVIATPSGTGTFTYTANSTTGNTACPSATSATATITVNSCGCTVTAGNSGPVCIGGTANLTATTLAGASYSWTGPNGFTSTSQNINALAFPTTPGTYTYTVTATLGAQTCTSTTDLVVNALPTIVAGSDLTICQGDNVTLSASGAATYSWSPTATNGVAFAPAASGTYTVTGTDANGCIASDQLDITVNSCGCTITANNSGPVCPGETVDLTSSLVAGASYSWSGPNAFSSTLQNVTGVISSSTSGTYTYTVTANVGGQICNASTDVQVLQNPVVNAGADLSICAGQNAVLTGSGATTYSWNPAIQNGVTFQPTSTTVYTVTGTANGCVGQDDVTITVNPLPIVNFSGNPINGCSPLDVTFTSTGNSTDCHWDLGNGSSSTNCGTTTTQFIQPGCYDISLTETSLAGCTSTTTLTNYICVDNDPVAAFNSNPSILTMSETDVQFTNNSIGASTYLWNFNNGAGNSQAIDPSYSFPSEVGTYEIMLIAFSPNNCSDTVFATVVVEEELIFYVPNSFTPDDDMYNPIFQPVFTSGYDPYDFTMLIYNRWGELIFESHDASFGWNGSYGNTENISLVQDGTYTWKIEFKTLKNDERKSVVGSVTLIR